MNSFSGKTIIVNSLSMQGRILREKNVPSLSLKHCENFYPANKSKKEAFFKTFLFLIFLVLVLLLIDVDKISNIFENSSDGSSQTAEFRG